MRLLVHFHIYYQDQIPYFLDRIANINGCEWDLIVTYSSLDACSADRIKALRKDAVFKQVENFGYDIWPFISVVKSVDISAYDLIMKLHTKSQCADRQRLNGLRFRGYRWRDVLVDSLLASPEVFRKNLLCFENDGKLGLLCAREVMKHLSSGSPEDLEMFERECARLGINSADRRFCAGTMFLARTEPYLFLKSDNVSSTLFEGSAKSHTFGTMSHVYERILTMAVTAYGLKLGTVPYKRSSAFFAGVHGVVSPILGNILSIARFGSDRIKCLVVFGIRIPLEATSKRL